MPQFERQEHRAMRYLNAIGEDYPNAWRLADLYRAARNSNEAYLPDWCYIPVSAALDIVAQSDLVRSQKENADMDDPERLADGARIAALAAWRMTKRIYRFDPWLYNHIISHIPYDKRIDKILRHLPEWCVYIETPGMSFENDMVLGAWCHLDSDAYAHMTLRILLDTDDPSSGTRFLSISDVEDICLPFDVDTPSSGHISHAINAIVSLMLYVCVKTRSWLDMKEPTLPGNPRPVRTRNGWRLFPVSSPSILNVSPYPYDFKHQFAA